MTQRYFMKITESNIAEGYVVPKSDLIDVLENGDVRLFSTSADHVEVDSKATAVANRNTKFDPTAEEGVVKTSESFTHLQNVNNRWNRIRWLQSNPETRFQLNNHKIKIYNITDSADVEIGTTEYSHASDYSTERSFVSARFTISGSKVYEIQHRCGTTRATDGFMRVHTNFGEGELFTLVEIYKEL